MPNTNPNDITIKEVKTKRELRKFIELGATIFTPVMHPTSGYAPKNWANATS